MGLTLEQIRQQFNIPKSASDEEVKQVALANNIVIDFTIKGAQSNSSQNFTPSAQTGLTDNKEPSVFSQLSSQSQNTQNSTIGLTVETSNSMSTSAQQVQKEAFVEEKNGFLENVRNFFVPVDKNDKVASNVQSIEKTEIKQVNNDESTKELTSTEKPQELFGAEFYAANDDVEKAQEICIANAENADQQADCATGALKNIEKANGDVKKQKRVINNSKKIINSDKISATKKQQYNDSAIAQITNVDKSNQVEMVNAVCAEKLTDKQYSDLADKVGIDENGNRVITSDAETAINSCLSENVQKEEHVKILTDMQIKMRAENQADAVKTSYENITDEKLKANFHDVTSNNIAKFDKFATMDIAQLVIANDDDENSGAQNMSRHAHETDKSVQISLAELLNNLNIEEVSKNLAANAYNFAEENQDAVVNMLQNSDYDSVKQTLDTAKTEYIAKTEAKTSAKSDNKVASEKSENKKSEPRTSSINVAEAVSQMKQAVNNGKSPANVVNSKEFKNTATKGKVEFVKSLSIKDKKEAVGSLCSNSTMTELKSMMFSGLKIDIIKYLVKHATPENLEKLNYLQNFLPASERKQLDEYREGLREHKSEAQMINNMFA